MVMLLIKIWTESRGRLPTYLLVRGSGPNVVHACNFFFFFLNEYKTCLPEVKKIWRFQPCVSEDQRFWILAHVFRGPRIFGLWLMFSKDQRFGILAHVFRGPRVSGFWLMFSEDRGFLDSGSCFQRTQDFWALAHVFRGPMDLKFGYYSCQCVWVLYLSSCKINISS